MGLLPDPPPLRDRLASRTPEERQYILERVRHEQEKRRTAWMCDWGNCSGKPHHDHPTRHARSTQRWPFKPDDGYWGCLWMAGRGFGKSRAVAEAVRHAVTNLGYRSIGLIARTAGDVRDVVVEGESGILNCHAEWERPSYLSSKAQVVWENGAIAYMLSSEKPDSIRGKQFDLVVFDEYSSFYKPDDVLSNALFALRLKTGAHGPRALFATTPKNTLAMRGLVKRAEEGGLKIVRGRTRDNLANLADGFQDSIMAMYEGTRTGKQELDGELLLDVEGALLKHEHFDFEGFRPAAWNELPGGVLLIEIVVAVDPAVTSSTKSDRTGITVVGRGSDGRYYVLLNKGLRVSPQEAMQEAVRLYHYYGANVLVAEVNNGGDYVGTVVHQIDPTVAFKTVRASVGKTARAEPVAMLYEQRRVSHVGHPHGYAALEDQWTSWVKDDPSPDELDSCVWGLTFLGLRPSVLLDYNDEVSYALEDD